MNISGNMVGAGNVASTLGTAIRTERNALPASSTDKSVEASSLASSTSTTVPRRSESVAQVESELSRQLTVTQATGAEADGAVPDTTTATSKDTTSSATTAQEGNAVSDRRLPPQSAPAEITVTEQPGAAAQLAVAQYQAHQSLLESSSATSVRRVSTTA